MIRAPSLPSVHGYVGNLLRVVQCDSQWCLLEQLRAAQLPPLRPATCLFRWTAGGRCAAGRPSTGSSAVPPVGSTACMGLAWGRCTAYRGLSRLAHQLSGRPSEQLAGSPGPALGPPTSPLRWTAGGRCAWFRAPSGSDQSTRMHHDASCLAADSRWAVASLVYQFGNRSKLAPPAAPGSQSTSPPCRPVCEGQAPAFSACPASPLQPLLSHNCPPPPRPPHHPSAAPCSPGRLLREGDSE